MSKSVLFIAVLVISTFSGFNSVNAARIGGCPAEGSPCVNNGANLGCSSLARDFTCACNAQVWRCTPGRWKIGEPDLQLIPELIPPSQPIIPLIPVFPPEREVPDLRRDPTNPEQASGSQSLLRFNVN